jgi:hydroxymethylbilane synthase
MRPGKSMSEGSPTLRLGTRGSLLARMQSGLVRDALTRAHAGLRVELVVIQSAGDVIQDRPLHELGGKGLFVKELEAAVLDGSVDLAVHSFKDVPVTMPLVEQAGLVVAATPKREDPRDVLVMPPGRHAARLAELAAGALVGTGSLRRTSQILHRRPDLVCKPMRGNVDTRLKKLAAGACGALVLALAGLRRCGLYDAAAMTPLDVEELLPAPGQGALALQCRRDDPRTRQLLAALDDADTSLCVQAERAVVQKLRGDCHSPIAALAVLAEDGSLHLRCAVGGRDGRPPVIFAQSTSSGPRWMQAVQDVYNSLSHQDVHTLLGTTPGG